MQKCKKCGGEMIFFDRTKRKLLSKYRKVKIVYVRRFRCRSCGTINRYLPKSAYPFKQYEKVIIDLVRDQLINSDTLGFENYPSKQTMRRWQKESQ